jgi:hypothetical protein
MADADLNLSDRFREKVALGAGPTLGCLLQLTSDWKAHLHGAALFYGFEEHEHYRAVLEQNYRLSREGGVTLKAGWERAFDQSKAEIMLSLNRYF